MSAEVEGRQVGLSARQPRFRASDSPNSNRAEIWTGVSRAWRQPSPIAAVAEPFRRARRLCRAHAVQHMALNAWLPRPPTPNHTGRLRARSHGWWSAGADGGLRVEPQTRHLGFWVGGIGMVQARSLNGGKPREAGPP